MILDTIAEHTRARVARERAAFPPAAMWQAAFQTPAPGAGGQPFPFERALGLPGMSFICEVKKASPSKGVIAEDFPYVEIAREYERAGAAAISVLTEPEFFLGSDAYLHEIVRAVRVPVLRKDFIVDEYQLYQARALGAAAVLLICALLDDAELRDFLRLARSLGLSALVEAHTEDEVARAVAAGARIVGVNNRDLQTFAVDLGTSQRLRPLVPGGTLFVSESGIRTAGDVRALAECGVDAVLVGETLMRQADKARSLAELRG
jgi:indole-3-glycerol phosphate synthase